MDTERNLPLSIIMGDMNGLKLTNDIFGHAAGEMLLQKGAAILKKVCRADDIIARIGGDEFVILLPKTDFEDCQSIMERIKGEFSKEHFKAIKGSISMGCAVKKRLDQDITQILQDAETQMYLDKTLHRKNNDREQMLRIVETLHERNPREKEHAEWVSAICERIGRLLGLPEREIVLLQKAGYLHDIGKIVLLDDGTPGKEGEMQQHPVIGYRILNSFEDTMDLAECVLAHHERWDGSGYLKGLKGNEIPKLARIIALGSVTLKWWAAGKTALLPVKKNFLQKSGGRPVLGLTLRL